MQRCSFPLPPSIDVDQDLELLDILEDLDILEKLNGLESLEVWEYASLQVFLLHLTISSSISKNSKKSKSSIFSKIV